MDQARNVPCLHAAQRKVFAKDLTALRVNKMVSKSSVLLKVSPTLEENLICVGGRQKHSNLATAEKPPPGDFSDMDLYTKQWRQVQALANQF